MSKIQEKLELWKGIDPNVKDHQINSYLLEAHLLYFRVISETNFSKKLNMLKWIKNITKQFSRSKRGIWIYASCMKYMHVVYDGLGEEKKAFKKLKKARRAVDWYKANNNRPYWSIDELLTNSDPEQENNLDFLMCKIMFGYWNHYTAIDNVKERELCVLGSVRLIAATLSLDLLSILNYDQLGELIKVTFNMNQLRQANHFLAGTWYYLMQQRASLDKSNQQTLNTVQAKLCQIFSDWGVKIVYFTLVNIKCAGNRSESKIDNDSYIEIPEFKVPGVQKYLNEFPIWPVTSVSEAKVLLKRAKIWIIKTISLLHEAESLHNVEVAQKRLMYIKKLGKQLNN